MLRDVIDAFPFNKMTAAESGLGFALDTFFSKRKKWDFYKSLKIVITTPHPEPRKTTTKNPETL